MTALLPGPERMERDLRAIGLAPASEDVERLATLAALVADRARTVNLVGPEETARLWSRHLLESAAFSLLLDRGLPVVDIGSGAGFPGLVLAVLGYGPTTLLEPRRHRRLFLLHAVSALGLRDLRVSGDRIEGAGPFAAGTQFTARAVAPPERLLPAVAAACRGEASLVCRIPPGTPVEGPARWVDLPCPPLDRPGLLVQVRVTAGPGRTSHAKGSG